MSGSPATAVLPRLLAGLPARGSLGFAEHEAIHGALPIRGDGLLAAELARAGLGGRGGAGFPTATKLGAVASQRGRSVVVANGCEGEPASHKDRLLLERLPHLVIDGALAAARAVGAREVVIAVDNQASRALRAVERALSERHDANGRRAPRVEIAVVPRAYVSGQETALVSVLAGGPARPSAPTPPVYERGLAGRPTLVDNVETLAHVALIARHGGDWFREVGTIEEPGSRLVTISGAVARPGVFEIESGAPLRALLDAAGGATAPPRAFLLGGYAGTWVSASRGLDLTLSDTGLARDGATLGAGIVVVLPETACGVAESARVLSWLADEGAGQCGPCINGLAAIAETTRALQHGMAGDDPLERLTRWTSLVRGRGACAHPDGAARLAVSALEVFGAEFDDHARYGVCRACAHRRVLPLPARPWELAR
jgi:NADH:ubiquinone oxidoreductase subunit F (NADH-binding)